MFYVYILKSLKYKNKIYIGSSADLKKRLEKHNSGTNKSTRYGIPWKVIYYEAFFDKKDAINREKRLKSGTSAIGFLKRRISNSINNS